MAEVSGGGGKLPDEAFASHARRPNPSVDEHVAFPEAPGAQPAGPGALPQTAWAPRSAPKSGSQPRQLPPELAPELAQIPPEVTGLIARIATRMPPRSRSHGRLNPVALGLAAVAALALIMGSDVSTQTDADGTVVEQAADWRLAEDGQVLELRELPSEGILGIQPDQATHEIPLEPSTIRVEVVSADPTAWIMVGSEVGDAQVWDAVLPYAAELDLETRPDRFRVTVYSRYGNATTQCRVYADEALVAIDTDYGSAECAADAIR